MASSDSHMCLCGLWAGDGAFHKPSWTPRKASSSSYCTNNENSFSQFSFSLDEDEIKVWVEIWIRTLQYSSTQIMDSQSSSSSNPPIGKRLFPENNSSFFWKRLSAWFSSKLSAQSSSTQKNRIQLMFMCMECIQWLKIKSLFLFTCQDNVSQNKKFIAEIKFFTSKVFIPKGPLSTNQ